jgi:hypothetical protein
MRRVRVYGGYKISEGPEDNGKSWKIDGVESPFVSMSMWRPDAIEKPEGTLVSYVTY